MNRQNEKRKIKLFKITAVLLPFVLVLFTEAGLRLCHYGNNLDNLFLTTEDGRYHYINKDITKRYFPKGQATTGNAEFFKKNKDNRTIRFFVIGESAALGFPYPNNITFSRMLKYTLKETYPDKDIEVINLSFSAVNSYTFYDFCKHLPDYSPDGILIYGGHNEYYGALGVASTSGWGTNPRVVRSMILLKRMRLYQLIENLIYSLKKSHTQSNDVLMQRVVKNQQIEYGGHTYQKGISQFNTNMQDLLNILEKAAIPVFLSTVPTNLKDLKPFMSCEDKDSVSGNSHFENGKLLYTQGNYKNALHSFLLAQQYDCLRFRAPEEINLLIRQFSNTYSNVVLVDSEKRFYDRSENKIPGNELLLEHVHPNIEGHKEIARAFYNEIVAAGLFDELHSIQTDVLLDTYPVLDFDSLAGSYAYNKLIEGFPFYQQTDSAIIISDMEKMAWDYTVRKNWYQSMEHLYQYAVKEKKYQLALDILNVRIIDNSYDPEFYSSAGEIYTLTGNYAKAIQYYEEAFRLKPSFQTARSIITTSLRNDDPEKAFNYIDFAIKNNQTSINFQDLKGYIETIIRLKQELQHTNEPAQQQTIRNAIAGMYQNMGNKEVATIYLQQ